jgi:hypothetical protein
MTNKGVITQVKLRHKNLKLGSVGQALVAAATAK